MTQRKTNINGALKSEGTIAEQIGRGIIVKYIDKLVKTGEIAENARDERFSEEWAKRSKTLENGGDVILLDDIL